MKNHEIIRAYQELGALPEFLDAPISFSESLQEIQVKEQDAPLKPSDCTTLEELKNALLSFEGCQLKELALNLVFSDGNSKAPLMLIGEAPGAEEDEKGLPFVGRSGQLLDKMLAAIQIDRTTCYIANIVPWRPPGNRTPSTDEIAVCLPFIERHIELVNPKLLVCLGGIALKALMKKNDGIMRLRGNPMIYTSPNLNLSIQTIATFHPAYLLRSPSNKTLAWEDLKLIKRVLETDS